MKDSNNDKNKLVVELKPCSRCGNPFMIKKGRADQTDELICDNCIQLEKRKRELQMTVFDEVIEVENKMEESIKEMKDQLTMTKGQFNKQFFLDKIKNRANALKKSIDLIEKIEETNDEKYIDEYKNLFHKLKKDNLF